MNNGSRHGYRGYIASRPVRGDRVPQRIANLVVRDYAARHRLEYKLSVVEHVMPACYMMLETLMLELPRLEGIIAFSCFMLPQDKQRRVATIDRILSSGCEIHFALENLAVRRPSDTGALEDLVAVTNWLPATPFSGSHHAMMRQPESLRDFGVEPST